MMPRLSRFLPKFLRGGDRSSESVKSGDKSHLKIIFLDDTEYFLAYKGSNKGLIVLEKVFEQLNLFEKDYFGLRFIDPTGQTHWLDCNKTLSSQLKGCSLPYTLYFGVKFYPADPCKLKEEITRYQFFMQVKQDILHGRLPVTFEEAAEMFAYAVQSELGDYSSQKLPPGYVSEFQFVPNQTEELEDQIANLHRRLSGTIPATAELRFLDKVKWLDMYGVDLHPVLGESNTEYFLGLTPTGIVVYKNKTKVGNYFWPRITKVTFKAKVFIIKVKDKINDEHVYAFELTTKAACKHLWKCCVEHHAFFRLNQLGEATSRTSKPFRSTAKHRNSGRSDRQSSTDGGRQEPSVMRVQSRRQARRAMSDSRLNQGDSMMTGVQFSEGHITMVVTPEQVKGPRHRSLPDLKGRESPTSTRSAPWETNMDTGLYTSGRESPVSVTQSENVNYRRHHRDSDSEPGHRRNHMYGRGYDSDGGKRVKQHHHHHHQQQYHHYNSGYLSSSSQPADRMSRRSGYESDPYTSGGSQAGSRHRRKYFPSSRKGSDNESDVSFTRRRRREMGDSGSESDSPNKYAARQRKAKSMGPDKFDQEWNDAVQNIYLSDREYRYNGSIPSLHSAPMAEARQKKMRRRRSKSPGTSKRPPEELKQHIEFELLDPDNLTEEQIQQMQDIPYVNVETKAEPFKVKYSPKTNRHRYRSPKRKSYGDVEGTNKAGFVSDDVPPPYTRTPDRTPEPSHRQVPKQGGYYSDTGSKVSQTGSLPREKKNQAPYNQQFVNNSSYSKHQTVTDIRSVPQFHDNLLFYEPNNSPRYQTNYYRNPMVHRYHPPPTAIFKPIEDQTDRGSTVEQATGNSKPGALHVKGPSVVTGVPSDLRLDLRGQLSDDEVEGQGHNEDRQRDSNRDSGLNSSQGSNSTMVNTPPRPLGRNMYGTQDAIARLYSSPAGTRKHMNSSGNQSNSPANRSSAFSQHHSASANHSQAYNNHNERVTNQNQLNYSGSKGPPNPHQQYNHYNSSQNPPYVNVSSVSSQSNGHQRHQNYNKSSYNQTRDFQEIPNGYGNGNYSGHGNRFYDHPDKTDSYGSVHDNPPASHSSGYNNNSSSSYNNNNNSSYISKNAQYTQQRYNGDSGFYGNGHQQGAPQRHSQHQMQTRSSQQNWQYVQANGESGNPQSTFSHSPYSQKRVQETISTPPSGKSPSTSPTKNNSVRRQVPLTPVRDTSRSSSSMIGRSPNVTSPDSAISSLTSLSLNNNNYKSPSGSVTVTTAGHMTQNGMSPSKDGFHHERQAENFSRTRMPAFGRSDIWTEL